MAPWLRLSSVLITTVNAAAAKSVDAQFRHKDGDKMFLPFTIGFVLFIVFMAAVNGLSRYVDKRSLLELAADGQRRITERIRKRHTRVDENGRTVLL